MREVSVERRLRQTANPSAVITVYSLFCKHHERLWTRREWIARNLVLMEEIGSERWLNVMLDALQGLDEAVL